MNLLQQIYPGDAVASFVIRLLAEITLVTLFALVFGRIAARRNPALRHGVCVCALMCVVIAPITTWGLQRAGWSTFQISLEPQKDPIQVIAPGTAGETIIQEIDRPQPFWTLERARTTASLIILIWLSGTLVLLSRLVNGSRKVRRLRLSARAFEHPKLSSALERLARMENLPCAPVHFSPKIHSPVVVGPLRTTVILPEKLLLQLDEQQLQCVLAHELTHVRQRDPLVGLVQRIVEAGYWPHPLVHVLNQDLVRAREEVCDNVALHGTTAHIYADTLLTVALGLTPKSAAASGPIGLMTRPWRLEERVKGLLDPQRRLTTTMNTRHLAFMAIALATGTTAIGGARIVAAPNPPNFQDIVQLSSHYNDKTKSVYVTAKTIQKGSRKIEKGVKVIATSSHPRTIKVALKPNPESEKVTTVVSPVTILESTDTFKPQEKRIQIKTTKTGDALKLQVEPGLDLSQVIATSIVPSPVNVFVTTTNGDVTKTEKQTSVNEIVTTTASADNVASSLANAFGQVKVIELNGKNGETSIQKLALDPTRQDVTVFSSSGEVIKAVENGAIRLDQESNVFADKSQKGSHQMTVTLDGKTYHFFSADGDPFKVVPKFEIKRSEIKLDNPFTTLKIDSNPKPFFNYKLEPGKPSKVFSYSFDKNLTVKKPFAKDLYKFEVPTFKFQPTPKVNTKPTTVYIQGGDIKIVGDNIKIIYVKPDSKKKPSSSKGK